PTYMALQRYSRRSATVDLPSQWSAAFPLLAGTSSPSGHQKPRILPAAASLRQNRLSLTVGGRRGSPSAKGAVSPFGSSATTFCDSTKACERHPILEVTGSARTGNGQSPFTGRTSVKPGNGRIPLCLGRALHRAVRGRDGRLGLGLRPALTAHFFSPTVSERARSGRRHRGLKCGYENPSQ